MGKSKRSLCSSARLLPSESSEDMYEKVSLEAKEAVSSAERGGDLSMPEACVDSSGSCAVREEIALMPPGAPMAAEYGSPSSSSEGVSGESMAMRPRRRVGPRVAIRTTVQPCSSICSSFLR